MTRRPGMLMLLAWLVPAAASPRDVTVPVDARAGPWSVTVNPQLPYGAGDSIAPVVVTGFPSDIDGKLEIIPDGTTTPDRGTAVDGAGVDGDAVDDNRGTGKKLYPSFYAPKILYPSNRHALTGVFIDAAGKVIGRPFMVGKGVRVTIPSGAHGLSLGFNDVRFAGNRGALTVMVRMPDE